MKQQDVSTLTFGPLGVDLDAAIHAFGLDSKMTGGKMLPSSTPCPPNFVGSIPVIQTRKDEACSSSSFTSSGYYSQMNGSGSSRFWDRGRVQPL
jgi:hypothetical protein